MRKFCIFSIPGPLTWAQTDNASTNCAIAPNPDECMREQTMGKWTSTDPLNYFGNRDLIKSGPFTASVKYDDQLSWILGLGYVRMLGEAAGMAMKLGLGANELRGNLTAGYAITDKQQVKLTYEYLAQNLPFDFATGTVNEWASQNAIGGAYQYLIRKGIVHSLELSGSYISAGSQDLPEIMFYQDAETEAVNLRRIAGGKEATALASVNLRPHPNTSVILGAGYSGVNYDTMYNNDQNERAIAFKAEIAHVINPTLKLETGVNNTAASMDSKVTFSKILPKNFEMALTGQYSQGRGNIQDSKTVMVGVSYPAPKNYAVNSVDKLTELKNWIEKPIVYAARVLAVKDEAVRTYVITTTQDLPDQVVPEGTPITSINTEDYFQFDPTIYDQVTYTFAVASMPNTPAVDGNALNLELVQDSPYQATLQSAAPLPYGTNGQYSITITATGERASLKDPVVKSDTFILTVQAIGPGWTDKTLPTAPMGNAYPTVELNEGYVTSVIPNDSFTFSLVNGPSWLQVKDGHLLTAVDGAVVPQNTTSVPITLKVLNSDNQPSQKDFNIAIDQQLPIWNQSADYKNWSIAYDDTTAGIPLQGYITAGNSNLTFSFANNQLTSGNWMIVNDNGNSYLRRTTPSTPLPSDLGTTANLTIVAHNSTSTTESQESNAVQKVAVIVLQDTNLPAPGWSNTQLAANAGDANYKVDLMPLVNGSVSGDSYTFILDNKGNTWLQLSSDGQSLISNGPVQPIGTDATGNVGITLKAVSHASNKDTGDIDFTITVTNFAPVWLDPPPADKVKLSYDAIPGNTGVSGVELNTLIGQNNSNLNFAFSSDGQKKTSDDGKWTIVSEGSGYALRLSQTDTSLIGATVLVKVFALNSTSNGGVPYELPISVTGDSTQPGANWNNNSLVGTTAGTNNYNDTVKKLFDCPAGDTCTVKVDLQSNSWLSATSNSDNTDVALASTSSVPAAASDTNGVSDPLEVTVTSRISGKVIQKSFTIPIENVLPEWIATPTGNQMFDGKSTANIYLNSAIDRNTNNGLTFIIDPNFADKGNWEIVTGNDGYYLHALNIAVDKIGTTILVPLIAKNTTSQNGAAKNAEVTIIADGNLAEPTWNNNQLTADAGDMAYKVDLPPLVNGSAAGDTYTFTLDNQGNTWLQLSADGQSLISNGVPPIGTGATGNVGVIITALSKASNKTTQTKNNFTITVTNFAPEWADAIPEQDIEYSAIPTSSVAGVGLNNLIKANNANLDFAFSATDKTQKTSSDGKWTIVADGNGYALKLVKEDANYIGQPADKVTVYAFNSTSNGSKDQELSIVVIGDASQPGATWNNNGLAGTTAGINNYNDAVKKLFDCPTDDICTVTVDLKNTATWLAKQANTDNTDVVLSSVANTVVPAAASDDKGVSDPIQITVTSRISGKQIQKDFTIPIENVLPEWTGSPTGTLMFDGKSPDDTIHLNPEIKDGTNAGLSFTIDPSFANNWQIINLNNSGEYYLQRIATSDVSDIDKSPISVSIIAKNTTSQNGRAGTAIITVTSDSSLTPVWTNTKIEDAKMGFPYGDGDPDHTPVVDLNTKVATSGVNDTFQFKFNDSSIAHPAWLSIDNNGHLVSDNVPNTVGTQFSVAIEATSKASGNKVTQVFSNVPIDETLPVWLANPTPGYQNWQIAYDDASQGIELSQFVGSGKTNLTVTFANPPNPAYWVIVNDNGKSYLRRNTAKDPMPSDVDTSVTLTLVARNSTSTSASQDVSAKQDVTVKVLPGTDISAPLWNNDNVPNAKMGFPYGDGDPDHTPVVDLTTMAKNPDVSNDDITFSFDDSDPAVGTHPTWLDIQKGKLVSTSDVPQTALPFSIKIIATSKASGKSTSKVFSNIQIIETPVQWQNVTSSAVQFNAATPIPSTGNLSDWVNPKTYNKLVTFELDTSGQATCQSTNYVASNWKLDTTAKTLSRDTAATPIDVGNTLVNVPVLASNDTSNSKVEQCLPVEVKPDTTLNINWKAGAALNGATAGSAIGTYSSNIDNNKNDGLFSCDASDICQISIDTSKISWLQSNISSDKKQASVTNNSLITMAGNDPSADTEPLSVTVTSLGSGKTETQPFKILVTNVLPEWISANPTTTGLIYDGSSPTTAIKLNDFIKPTAAGITTTLSFKAGAGFDTNKWKIEPVANAGITEYYLVKIGGDPSEVNTTAKVTVDATNSTSTTPIPNELQIPLLPDTGLVLEQKGGLVTAARMGYDYATANVKLSDYVTTKDGAGNDVADNYEFTPKTNVPTWLNIDRATGSLTSTNTDPNNTDPNIVPRSATATDFDVDVTSKASGATTTFTFHIDVNTVAPIWGQIQPLDVKFTDDQTQLPTNQTFADFLSQGADYSSFRIDTSNPEKCANFVANNWQPFSGNDAKHINRTAAGAIDPSDIANGTAYAFVPLVASNTTSPASADAAICVPINVTADSSLTISGNLTTANMGSSDYSDDLNKVVTTQNGQSLVSDSYKFTVDSKNPLPTWLSLDSSTGILSANSNIPTTADLPTQVTVDVNSKATGETKPITLTLNIRTEDPVWNPIPQSAVVFTQKTTFPANGLTNYVKPSTLPNNINSFSVDDTVTCPISNYISKNWDLSNSSLMRSDTGTQTYADVNEDENNPATIYIPVRLANTTSPITATTCVPVTVNPDHNLAGPTISGQPIAATAGDLTYTYSFAGNTDPNNNLVTCPSGDSCKIKTVDLTGLNWLQQTITPDGQNATLTLAPSASVPAALDSNTAGHSSPFSVKVYSIASGNSVTQDVRIPITNVMPEWDKDKLPTDKNPAPIMFDAKATAAGINLNQYIKDGTIGLTIAKNQGFDSTKWNIVQEGNNFILVRITTDTSDINTMYDIPLVAANTTSFGTVPASIKVIVTVDTSLPGPTINSTLGGTQAGNAANSYSYNLKNLFNCYNDNGIQDVCTITEVNLNSGSDPSNKNPTFLQADAAQGTLINNAQVPAGPSDAAPAGWPISVTVTSKASGKTAVFTKGTDNQNLQVLITNTQPQWTSNFPSLSIDDADTTTGLPSTGLSSLLTDGTKVGLTFSQGSNADAAQCPSANYNSNNWKLSSTDATASLQRAQSDVNDQFKTVLVPIKAYNTTSISGANGVIGCVPVSVVSKLTFITTSGSIKFDALGEDKAVGSDLAAQGGFDITAAVSNADKYSNLRFDWGNGVAAPDYWQIKQDSSNKHYYILRNKKDNGTGNQVSAEGIGGSAKVLNIQACYGDTSSATCVAQPINMTLQGDPNLVYSASGLPSTLSTKSYEPFTANTQSSNVDLIPSKNVMGYMPATAGGYQVIGDEATYTYNLVKDTPSFVGVNSQKLVIYQGSFDDFNNNTVVTGDYLQVSTAANNNTQVKVTGMPPVAINELYMTPPSSSSDTSGYKASGALLGNATKGGGVQACSIQSYVYLNVQNLKDGQYYLSQIKAYFPSSNPAPTNKWQQVCPGKRTTTNSETNCGDSANTKPGNFSSVSTTQPITITAATVAAGNTGVSFLASAACYGTGVYPTIVPTTPIIISHQPIFK